MKTIPIEALSRDAFDVFGMFADMLEPQGPKIGEPPCEFFRDMVQQDWPVGGRLSYSTCRVYPREMVVDLSEFHAASGEGMLPLDGDVVIHVGEATIDEQPPVDAMRAFRIPRGTMVCIKPGVWHQAAYPCGKEPIHILIVLPERAYYDDLVLVEHANDEKIHIDPRTSA